MILYTLYKNSYIDIAHLESTKGITCYVNSTNRCTCSCTFCLRQTKEMIENNSLWLKEEPTVDEIIQEFEKYNLNFPKDSLFFSKLLGETYPTTLFAPPFLPLTPYTLI